eukprot:6464785-Prymnesium_polylepis.1
MQRSFASKESTFGNGLVSLVNESHQHVARVLVGGMHNDSLREWVRTDGSLDGVHRCGVTLAGERGGAVIIFAVFGLLGHVSDRCRL